MAQVPHPKGNSYGSFCLKFHKVIACLQIQGSAQIQQEDIEMATEEGEPLKCVKGHRKGLEDVT